MMADNAGKAKRIRNSALLFAAISLAFYLGFILIGVLKA